jgi:hypothetical protein
MAGTSLLTLIDDIANILDDVATLTKSATKQTAGVLGDDLALNAEQVAGVNPDRELPVVWAVAKGSALNKAIIVPAALAISAIAPWAITPLLMIGGLYLCFEGVEKLAHKFLHHDDEAPAEAAKAPVADAGPVDLVELEREKIKGAVRTDFVLSAEIVVITLGSVATEPFATRVMVMVGIALVMTVGVYGLVAGIVKLDDAGLYLSRRQGESAGKRLVRALGRGLLRTAPALMKFLSVAGTVAMFLVGGGIVVHGIAPLHHFVEHLGEVLGNMGGFVVWLATNLSNMLIGMVAGAIVLAFVTLVQKLRKRKPAQTG